MFKIITPPLIALLFAPVGADKLVPQFETEQTITRTFEITREISLDETSMETDAEIEFEGMDGEYEEIQTDGASFTVVDTYKELGDEGPTKLVREYGACAISSAYEFSGMEDGPEPMEEEHNEELDIQDRSVEFIQKDGEVEAKLVDDGDSDPELKGLSMRLDFLELLPENPSETAEAWEIPVSVYDTLLHPLGAQGGHGEGNPMDDVEPEVKGTFTAKRIELIEKDGLQLAKIELKVDRTQTTDLTDMMSHDGGEEEDPEMMMPEMESFVIQETLSGKGFAYWDIKNARWHSLKIESEVAINEEMVMLLSMGEEEEEMTQVTDRSGTETISFLFE